MAGLCEGGNKPPGSLKAIADNVRLGQASPLSYAKGCSVLLYGAHSWSLTERERDMLRKCQRKMERKTLNITLRHRLRNEDIRRQTHLKDAAETADKLKKKWAGHVMRLNANRWTHILRTWDPRIGKRNAGR
ncbi:hypothetical protein ANN_20861 [Periplaneta americana]|uniref:Reverse transcriptase n=1 Tax=Periplaneta americana TaxID=6978 RepID=A0ABQ8SEJ4_PERAM|nr:hypothetical protein ANN_20861 [Periplaneta americana]